MRYHELINEAVTAKELILYHGTNSDPFDTFDGAKAAKGEQFWNPLGDGMYATDSERFAQGFGGQVHEVVIPPGSTYKRITNRDWAESIGRNIVFTALKAAMKACGESYDAWQNGTKPPAPKVGKMSDADIVELIIQTRYAYANDADKERMRERGRTFDRSKLLDALKDALTHSRRVKDDAKSDKIYEFRLQSSRMLETQSPYESLYEMTAIVRMIFGDAIAEKFEAIVPETSNRVFKKYDFVIFTDTNDVIGLGKNGKSALEIVIFNPALQKTRAVKKTRWNEKAA